MKTIRLSIFISALVSLTCLLKADVSNYSYRIKGLGPAVMDFTHDSYSDVFYNPAYIANVEGLNVYTNLSNLGSVIPVSLIGNELSFIRNAIFPANLVGFMGRWKFLSGGAFYVTEGYTLKMESDDRSDYEYSWEEEGQTHSSKSTSDESGSGSFRFGGRQLIGVGTMNLFGFRLGVMGKFRTFSLALDGKSETVDKSYSDGELVHSEKNKSSSTLETGTTFMGLIAGTVIGGENTELSVAGGIQPGGASLTSKFVDDYFVTPYYQSNYYIYKSEDQADNFYKDYDSDELEYSVLGSELFAKVRLMKRIGSTRTSIFGRASTALFPIDIVDESTDKNEKKRPDYYPYYDSTTVYSGYYLLDETVRRRNGSGSINVFQLKGGIGFERAFSSNTMLILGVKGNYLHIGGSIERDPKKTAKTYKYLWNTPDADHVDDGYVTTTMDNVESTLRGSGNFLYLEIPSAIEFNIQERFQFRAGVNQIFPIYASMSYHFGSTDKPDQITTQYTHGPKAGTTEITTQDAGTSDDETDFKLSSTNLNLSSYYSGLGFKVNENVTVDIIHYAYLTNIGTWYLSFSIKF